MTTYLRCLWSYVTFFSRRNSFHLLDKAAILYSKLSHLQYKNVTKFTVLRDKWARISVSTCSYERKCSLLFNVCPKRKSSFGITRIKSPQSLSSTQTTRTTTKTKSGFGGLEVACWPLVPKFAGSNPAEAVGFFRAKKILSTPSFGGELKSSVPCRRFAACKRFLNVTWKSGI